MPESGREAGCRLRTQFSQINDFNIFCNPEIFIDVWRLMCFNVAALVMGNHLNRMLLHGVLRFLQLFSIFHPKSAVIVQF